MTRCMQYGCLSLLMLMGFASLSLAQHPLPTSTAPIPVPEQAVLPASAAHSPECHPCPPTTMKVCVPEPKKNTKIAYDCKTKDYCMKSCSQLLREYFTGHCECEATCGEVHTKKVLIKKVRHAPDTVQCVVKEVPINGCLAPSPASGK